MVEKPQRLPPGERPFVVPCARLSLDAPWRWLRLGWQDFWRAPRLSLIFGMAIMLISVAVSALAQLVILLVWSRAGMMLSAFFPFDANDTAMLVEYLAVGSAIGTVFAALTLTWPGPVRCASAGFSIFPRFPSPS